MKIIKNLILILLSLFLFSNASAKNYTLYTTLESYDKNTGEARDTGDCKVTVIGSRNSGGRVRKIKGSLYRDYVTKAKKIVKLRILPGMMESQQAQFSLPRITVSNHYFLKVNISNRGRKRNSQKYLRIFKDSKDIDYDFSDRRLAIKVPIPDFCYRGRGRGGDIIIINR